MLPDRVSNPGPLTCIRKNNEKVCSHIGDVHLYIKAEQEIFSLNNAVESVAWNTSSQLMIDRNMNRYKKQDKQKFVAFKFPIHMFNC